MKNLLISLSLILTIGLISCKKTEIQPVKEPEPTKVISIFGKWQLIGGDMYMENLDTHVKTKYNHFNSTKLTSSLRYEGALYPVETLTNNVTTWSIYQPASSSSNDGIFVLNGDSTKLCAFHITPSNWSITELSTATATNMQMGGTSLPLSSTISDYDNKICDFTVFESFVVINNENYNYFSVLHFKKIQEW